MGYGLQRMYGVSLRDEHGSTGFLWVTRDYGLIELWVRRASTVLVKLHGIRPELDEGMFRRARKIQVQRKEAKGK